MKIKNLSIISALGVCLLTPVLAQASTYEEAAKEARLAIEKAKSLNYEWRDSRKFLKKADKLYKAGKTDEAMKLVKKARMQGDMAVTQARLYSNVNGPHQ